MSKYIVKRDNRNVEYDISKIINAVQKSMKGFDVIENNFAEQIANQVDEAFKDHELISINDIQKKVEEYLMKSKYPDIARSYIEYRHDRDVAREKNSKLNSDIKGLIEQSDLSILNENANKDSKVIPTQRDLLAGIISKHYAKNHILPKDVVAAHEAGEIHYHDLDYAPFFPMFNCMIVDLKGMLTNGFKMGNADIETPKSISTATALTAQIIAQVASHTYGGTTINRIDEILAPYVICSYNKHLKTAEKWNIPNKEEYAEALTHKECYDAFQGLEYEINTLHTSNGQTPFVTFGFGLGTSKEAKLIQESILKNRIAGLGRNKKTAIFPKLVFAIREGVNSRPEDPNYDVKQIALECATKRMYPDILNYDQVVKVTGSFKTPMGCRSFLGVYVDENGEEVHDGRNNLGVVSLNLPRIGIESKGDINKFWTIFNERLDIAKKALLTRIERLSTVKAKVAPILYTEGALGVRLKPEDNVIEIFKNGRASISLGYIGIYETINAVFNDEVHMFDDEVKKEFGVEIVRRLRDAVEEWKNETGYGFSLYSTPSENLCDRFCSLDKKNFGEVKGVTDKGYYTNSFHLDVQKKVNPYEKIKFEMPYPSLANGGFICYGEFPNLEKNKKALEDVWDYSYSRVPYYGTNTPIDECYKCGYTGEFDCTSKGFSCPQCGNHEEGTLSVIRRVCGYLGSPDTRPFNKGKQEEVIRRVKHL